MVNERVLKVFHAARQDIEIFFHLSGRVPTPIFDTQVAAMVCGFGESVAYDTLAAKLANARIDKSSRFTDWSHRPLTDKQLQYALADVTHLRTAYERIAKRLAETGRADWLGEEMAVLTSPSTYDIEPRNAWQRIRTRSTGPRFLALLRELAAWREEEARRRDVPRPRILRDESLAEIAAHPPATPEALARMRGLGRDVAFGALGRGILAAVERAQALPDSECPAQERREALPGGLAPVVELLRVLLRMKSEASDVAPRLIASGDDLEMIAASDEARVPCLSGWRREIFGESALALKHGQLALTVTGRRVQLVPINETDRKKAVS
jgi:ribonuclease D